MLSTHAARNSRRALAVLSACTLTLLVSCATSREARESKTESEKHATESKPTLSKEHSLALARQRIELARLRTSIETAKSQTEIEAARHELDQARAKLEAFDKSDAPIRLAHARAELDSAHDTLFEQKEELAQLVKTYAGEELADSTRDIVLTRGKRRVQRAEEHLALQERELATLENSTLPRERVDLVFEAAAKESALENAKRSAEATRQEKAIDVASAECELEKETENNAKESGS